MDVLIEQEIALHQHEIRTDREQVERLLHPDFVEIGRSGKQYDFQSIWDSELKASNPQHVLHSQDYLAVKLSPGVMLLLYQTATKQSVGGYSDYAKRSSVWVFNESCWQMIYHQGTPCEAFEINA